MRDLIKAIALIKRRPDISREQFARHYEEVHAPLALRYFRDWSGYIRNHVVETLRGREPAFDCISEFWFSSWEGIKNTVEFTASAAAQPLRDDELSFMDRDRNVSFMVSEEVVLGDPMCLRAEAPAKAVALVERRGDVDRGELLAGYEKRDLPRLLDAAAAVRCVQNRVEPEAAVVGETAVECITEIWFEAPEDRLEAMGRFQPEAGSVTLLAVSEFESDCGG
jgi:uncharacterized protein (TIGR02118 family)